MAIYTVKKRLVSVGRDYDVQDENGATVFTIDGKVRFARTFDVKDRDGHILYSAKEQLLTLDQTFLVDASGADQLAVKRTTTGSVYPMKFDISVGDEARMHAVWTHRGDEAAITRAASKIASVSRQQNTVVAEIFHVWAADGEDPALILAIAMVIVEGDQSRGQAS